MKIEQAIDNYRIHLRAVSGLGDATIDSYLSDLNIFFKTFKDIKDTSDLTSEDLILYNHFASQNQNSPSTIARKITSLTKFYNFLESEKIIDFQLEKVKRPKKNKKLYKYLNKDEMEKFLDEPSSIIPIEIRDKAILETIYACGLRISEALSLKTRDINFERKLVHVSGKGNKQRYVPISDRALDEINYYILIVRNKLIYKNSEFLFLSLKDKTPLDRSYFYKRVVMYGERAGIKKKVTPHMLRHSFATHLLESRCSLTSIKKMLGHESIATTQEYTHIANANKVNMYESIMEQDKK